MIKLKSGTEIAYDENFDLFFQKILSSIIAEAIEVVRAMGDLDQDGFNRALAKDIMDNSIFVTHQIFDIARINQNLARFLVTGFLFNSIILSIPNLSDAIGKQAADNDNSGIVH
jgi:hypothetical protein